MSELEDFENAYETMKEVRNKERNRIIEMMKEKGWCVCKNGGRGRSFYSSGKRIAKYNLGNWMYIQFEIPNLEHKFCLDLQSFDTDPSTANSHFLDQRLSLYACLDEKSTKFLTIPGYIDENELKSFDLPLSDRKITMLLTFIDRYTAWYCKMPTFSKNDLIK